MEMHVCLRRPNKDNLRTWGVQLIMGGESLHLVGSVQTLLKITTHSRHGGELIR